MKSDLLLALNDAPTADRLRDYFERRGILVQTTTSGIECLEKLRSSAPRLLLLQWELLWGGGDGVLAVMREEAPPGRTSVLLLANHENAANLRVVPPVVGCFATTFDSRRIAGRVSKRFALTAAGC
ncbi:MAG: hypothetical protein RIC55_21715 [Pirellulaceae bacterium]